MGGGIGPGACVQSVRVVRSVHRPSSIVDDRRSTIDDGRSPDNFEPLIDPFALPRVAVTAAVAPIAGPRRRNQIDTSRRSLVGTLVHRLFERFSTTLEREIDRHVIADELARLLRDEEAVEVEDLDRLFGQAREAYLALCRAAVAASTRSKRAKRSSRCRFPPGPRPRNDPPWHVRLPRAAARRRHHRARVENRQAGIRSTSSNSRPT